MTSTGPLHFGLTPGDLFAPHESRPWNPLIARTFYRRGIIEEWGRGTIKIAELAISAGLPRPEIDERGDCVTVRFLSTDETPQQAIESDLTGQQTAVLALLRRSDRALALRELRGMMGGSVNDRRLREDLAILRARGLVELTGLGRGARWRPR